MVFVDFLNNSNVVKTKPKIAVINKMIFNLKLFYNELV